MSTLSITVEHTNQAYMLADWLKNIRFVREVAVDVDKTATGNADAIQKNVRQHQIRAIVFRYS